MLYWHTVYIERTRFVWSQNRQNVSENLTWFQFFITSVAEPIYTVKQSIKTRILAGFFSNQSVKTQIQEILLRIDYHQILQFSRVLCAWLKRARNFPALLPKNQGQSTTRSVFKGAVKPLRPHEQDKTSFYLTTKVIFQYKVPVKLPNGSHASFCNRQLLSSLVSEILSWSSIVMKTKIQLSLTEHWIFHFICQKDGIVWSLQLWLNEKAHTYCLATLPHFFPALFLHKHWASLYCPTPLSRVQTQLEYKYLAILVVWTGLTGYL